MEAQPEHSALGASSAERWMNCPGSVALIKSLGPAGHEDSEYAAEGTMAHALAAHCLNKGLDAWEALGEFPGATQEMSSAVQTYLDYVRRHGNRASHWLVEQHVSHSSFHRLMYGTVDLVDFDPEPDIALEIDDYKHGVGVAVDVEENVQLRYYAFALISGEAWPANTPRLGDMARIKLTICQPRGYHPDGPIRSWIVTAGEIRNWAYNELHPAMKRAQEPGELAYKLGEHCRFCPAKLVCPEQRKLATDAALAQNTLTQADGPESSHPTLVNADDEWLGAWYKRLSVLKMFIKAIEGETSKRMLLGRPIDGAKLVYGKVDRVWKDDAKDPDFGTLVSVFGDQAWEPRKLRSPASVETLPGGKDFCAEWAMKPEAGLVIAPVSDKRAAQIAKTNEEVFANVEIPLTPTQ